MAGWSYLPALLGLTITLVLWNALRLLAWARAPQNVAGALLLTAMATNLLGYLFQLVLGEQQLMLAWQKVQIIGLNLVYPAWLVFVFYLTGHARRVTPRLLVLLGLLSLFPIATALIPETQAWFVRTEGVIFAGNWSVLKQQIGWVVWVSTAIAQIEGLIGMFVLAPQLRRVRPAYRPQLVTLILAQGFAYAAIWLELSGANPVAPLSVFNLSFIPACLAISWAIFGLRVGQTLPIMRGRVIETMHDGVIILNSHQEVEYLNPVAQRMFPQPRGVPAKVPLADLAPALAQPPAARPVEAPEEHVNVGGVFYSVSRSVLEDWKGDTLGQVLVLRNTTDRELMAQALQRHVAELARSSLFAESLSLLAARVAGSASLEQVYGTLSDELHRLGLEYCVGLRTPGQQGYTLAYVSLENTFLRNLEKLAGVQARGFRIPELGSLPTLGVPHAEGAIFSPNLKYVLPRIFDKFPPNFDQVLGQVTGHSLDIASWSFRLVAQGEDIGMLAVWGPSLRQADHSPLATFAAQVSAAIQKARLIQKEQTRVRALERINRLFLSLTQVAARFEADLDLDQILATLGLELAKLEAYCLIGMLDADGDELAVQYTSADPSILQAAEKVLGFTLHGFRYSYARWRTLNQGGDGLATVVEDPAEYVHKILSHLPLPVIHRVLELAGITPAAPPVWMPLRAGGRLIGVLVVWGIPEPLDYLTFFPLFATLVATTIEKARLMADLQRLKSFNEGIVQSVAEAILVVDGENRITFANPAAGRLAGREAEDLVGQDWKNIVSPGDHEKVRSWMNGNQAAITGAEFSLVGRDGRPVPVLVNLQSVSPGGQSEGVLVSVMDIHERVQAEQQIRASIAEKEALLKEIHHRVKNNLQIVSSLLSLQAGRVKDASSIEAFRESQHRVRSMALLHERLYRSDSLARIRMDEYIRELCQYLLHSYQEAARNVRLDIQAEPVYLDIDAAIPCGLIINELVSNSLKHGFPAAGEAASPAGRIGIRLTLLPKKRVNLLIQDNGPGFPPDLDDRMAGSLGLQLVTSLTQQLEGEIVFKSGPGAQVEICFEHPGAYLG